MTTLLWFRRDLRLGDHPALAAAAAAAADGAPDETNTVLACFVVDPGWRLRPANGGCSSWATRCDSSTRIWTADCWWSGADPSSESPRSSSGSVPHRYTSRRTTRHLGDDATSGSARRSIRCHWSQPVHRIWSRPAASPNLTAPHTRSSRHFRAVARSRVAAARAGRRVRWVEPSDIEPCEIPDPGVTLDVTAGEAAARSQWAAFVDDGLQRYADDRNRPDLPGTSRMSAHLKFGTIHPRTMAVDLNPRRKGDAAYLRELAFRDFYASVLHHWPDSAWWNWNRGFDAIQTDTDADAERRFEAWKAGETGFPLVDAGMRQLRETGWLHNRLRMIVASFLVRTCTCPGNGGTLVP